MRIVQKQKQKQESYRRKTWEVTRKKCPTIRSKHSNSPQSSPKTGTPYYSSRCYDQPSVPGAARLARDEHLQAPMASWESRPLGPMCHPVGQVLSRRTFFSWARMNARTTPSVCPKHHLVHLAISCIRAGNHLLDRLVWEGVRHFLTI